MWLFLLYIDLISMIENVNVNQKFVINNCYGILKKNQEKVKSIPFVSFVSLNSKRELILKSNSSKEC